MTYTAQPHRIYLIISLFLTIALTGCGGGGAGNATNTSASSSSSSTSASSNTSTPSNQVAIIVDSGPTGNEHNLPYVTIKLCAPGSTTNCATIDHIQLDTGSTGLRLLADPAAVSTTLNSALPQISINSHPLTECMQFFDGYAWGPVKQADITIAGYTVNNMAVQIIGDTTYTIPTSCSNTGTAENTIATFGAKGILGISPGLQDCGSTCVQTATTLYYSCSSANNCQSTAVPLTSQLQNIVAQLPSDKNGTLIQLPTLTAHAGKNIQGTLTFGIGTRTNNSLGTAAALTLDPTNFNLSAQLQGSTYSFALIDSGTTDWIFDDNGNMPVCSNGFYCPSSSQTITTIFKGANNISSSFNFSIANATTAFNTSNTAFDNVGAPAQDTTPHTTFIAGLPFFFGRSVWTALEEASTPAGTGPFIAFQ